MKTETTTCAHCENFRRYRNERHGPLSSGECHAMIEAGSFVPALKLEVWARSRACRFYAAKRLRLVAA